MKRFTSRILTLAAVLAGLVVLTAAAPAPATPETFTNSIGMKLVAIPAGTYRCYGQEIEPVYMIIKPPGFEVTIEEPFWIGACEVTARQYATLMDPMAEFGRAADEPVSEVTWDEARAFCEKLSALPAEQAAGRVYSLPTEREWQYAARAGSDFMFPYGDNNEQRLAEVAVCRDIYTHALPTGPADVASKQPNAWGLYDCLGNVWEWVADSFPARTPPNHVPATATAAALTNGDNRAIVGGGWDNDFRMCNLASRYSAPPGRRADNIGFRVRCVVREEIE